MPPLADLLYAACANPMKRLLGPLTPDNRRRLGQSLKTKIRDARRYYIDSEVALTASQMGIEHPDILFSMLHRARLPFATCWVEWDNHALYGERRQAMIDQTTPLRVGCLLERLDPVLPHYRLSIISGGCEYGRSTSVQVAGIVIEYRVDQPMAAEYTTHALQQLATLSRLPSEYVQKSLIGSAYIEHGRRAADEIAHLRSVCDTLTSHATITLSAYLEPVIAALPDASGEARTTMSALLRSEILDHAGTWRFIIALFALINTPDYIDAEASFRQGKSRITGGKTVPYLQHRMVKLRLARPVVETRMRRAMAEAIPRRRHGVSGHWRQSQSRGLAGCEHIYVDETPTRQVCVTPECGHKRWWVPDYERGDASKGYVTKDRLVTRE